MHKCFYANCDIFVALSTNPPIPFRGRFRELGLLRTAYDRPEASVGWVVGPSGVGKTATVLHAAADFRSVYHRAPPLSDAHLRAALARDLTLEGGEPPSWEELFLAAMDGCPPGRVTVLIVDDAHRWIEARARFVPALDATLREARAQGKALHVTLVAPEVPAHHTPSEWEVPVLALGPLPFRSAVPFLPGATAADRLQAYAMFGGLPGVLSHLDPDGSTGTQLRRLVLAPDAPLRDLPLTLLERTFQTPTRYAAILAALAPGEGDWAVVRDGVPDLSASGQAAPYLKRLEEVGLVEVRRSLDASPRTRNRRYRITDPFVAFWFRFLLPHRHAWATGESEALLSEVVRPGIQDQVWALLPQVCREYMAHDALERLGAQARETGSLWGVDYAIPVAGILATGAPFYGTPVRTSRTDTSPFTELDRAIGETRYGFGRELRLRILFLDGPPSTELQRSAARRHDAVLLTPEDLAGG